MGIVGNAGRYRTVFQSVAAQEAKPNVAGVVVALKDCHFYDVLVHVHAWGVSLFFSP